tara:strand:+ start:467 stop:652 length:186 start_codon:yes stop_codon:yes gene_type:complete
MKEEIINYLVRNLLSSLVLYYVNGTEDKRLFRIKEVANNIYNNMSEQEKEELIKKINSNKI